MKLEVEQHADDKALVTTDNVNVVCDDAIIDKKSGHLRLGYDHTLTVEIEVGDVEVAHNAMNAVRRAIKYDETWEAVVPEDSPEGRGSNHLSGV